MPARSMARPTSLGDGAAGRQRAKRRMNPQENMVIINLRAIMDEVMQQGIAGRLGKRQPAFAASFSDNAQPTQRPVDIRQAQVANVAGTKTQA